MNLHSSIKRPFRIAFPAEESSLRRLLCLGLFTPALLLAIPGSAQQTSTGPYLDASSGSYIPSRAGAGADVASANADNSGRTSPNGPSANGLGARDERIEPLNETGGCGDPLSAALHQDGDQSPCWADLRAVDHWNTMTLANGPTVQNGPGFLPAALESPAAFTFAVGGLGGLLFANNANSSAYAGAGAFSGYVERPRWQLMYEDGGGLGNFMLNGSHLAGLNRAAIRANGDLSARWLWQGSATNAYGNDTLRLFAPLDYRTVGATEAPVTDTVAYGLHTGNLVDEQEDFKLSTSESRRSNWNFAAAHTLRYYADDGVNVQTVRGRGQYIYATSQNTALGVIAGGAYQNGPSECSLGGAGLLALMKWGPSISLNVSGSANGASSSCGKSVQFTGDASLYIRADSRDDIYFTGNRDLSGGVVENLAFLDSAGGGIRHQFSRNTNLRLDAAAIYGTDPKTRFAYNGVFTEAAFSYPRGAGFLQETSYRHYQVDKVPGGDNRNLVTFTLWWSPRKNRQTLLSNR